MERLWLSLPSLTHTPSLTPTPSQNVYLYFAYLFTHPEGKNPAGSLALTLCTHPEGKILQDFTFGWVERVGLPLPRIRASPQDSNPHRGFEPYPYPRALLPRDSSLTPARPLPHHPTQDSNPNSG